MKQTVVEWLVEQLEGDDAIIARVIGLKKYNEIYKKAKELHKQQIIDAHCDGQSIEDTSGVSDAKDYYNETFNK
jgi:hypothetical protein